MTKVLVGMSGGVDSSVAAYILKEEGYEVIGATLVLFDSNKEIGCTSNKAVEDAAAVCKSLSIEHHVVEQKEEFKKHVIENFIDSYHNAKTPNPCIECNRYIKFGVLWDYAQKLNCDYIATGHYAKIENNHLCKIDSEKDQTYFLYKIDKKVLPHILFPLNKFTKKEEIRNIAKSIGLKIHDKKDSQDICFVENNNYANFLEQYSNKLPSKGNFVLKDGTIIGEHKGIYYYTIGQRKGLGISYQTPLYVIRINPKTNEIILGNESDLYQKEVLITNINLLVDNLPTKAKAKIRFKSPLVPCTIKKISENELKIIFEEEVKSSTPGQALVLYDEDICLGGGTITD